MKRAIRTQKAAVALLLLMLGLISNSSSQTPSFEFLHGASDDIIAADFDRDSSMLFTLDKAGFIITWDVNNMYPIRKFYAVPSYVFATSKSPYHVDRKMLKVAKNRIWVYDASNGLGTVIIDSYDRINGNYIPVDEIEQKKFKREFVDDSSPAFYPKNLSDIGRGKDSFSNYKLAYSHGEVNIYNSAGIRVKKLDNMEDLNLFGITAAFFITDNVLLVAGKYPPMANDKYASSTKSALIKVNWKTEIVSRNRSYDYELGALSNAKLEVAGDSVVIIKDGTNRWRHQIKPSQLINNFDNNGSFSENERYSQYLSINGYTPKFEDHKLEEGQDNRVNFLNDSYISGNIFKIKPITNTEMALISKQPDGTLGEILTYKHMTGFIPIKFHSKQKLIIWQGPFPDRTFNFMVSDFEGKEIKRFTMEISDSELLTFSADGKWFTLMKNSSEIELYNTRRFDKPIVLNTGASPTIYLPNKIQFNENSTKLAYNVYDPVNQSQFIVAVYDLTAEKQDTLFKIGIAPDSWALDKDFGRAAISCPVNFADTSIFNNKERSEQAIKNKFRDIYSPTILVLDIPADSIEQVIQVRKQNPVRDLAFMGKKLVSLQQDGLLHYYGINNQTWVTQWVYGNDQAIISEGSYYATPGLIDYMLLGNNGSNYPVAEQDILFNAPHKVLEKIDGSKKDIAELYQLAYEKRLKQYNTTRVDSEKKGLPVIRLPAAAWNDFTRKDSVLNLTLEINDPTTIEKLLVRVNGFSIFGKQGFSLNGALKNITLTIPLDSGYNEVRIQAVDKLKNYSIPINLEYEAKFEKPHVIPKLWILSAGVSKYADSLQNLSYAAKDAGDFVKVFAYKTGYETEIITLTDTLARAESIASTISSSKLRKNDVMLVYLAGHGMLDGNGDFYFAGHDMDFQNPAKKGLSYSKLMELLEAVPARNKVLFLDACNSGFVDKSVYTDGQVTTSSGDHMTLKNTRGSVVINRPTNKIPDKDVFMFMQKTFSDLSQDNNISILSAALGNSYALETSELSNGLFTYSMIKGLGLAKASSSEWGSDRNYGERSVISISDLAKYLDNEVKLISKGAQTPSFSLSKNATRIIFSEAYFNAEMELGSYKTLENPNQLSKAEEYKLFLDRYKD